MSARVAEIAQAYYDSPDADAFYHSIWGGQDIHIGLYRSKSDPVADASRRTVETMASMVELGETARVLDLGAGYGGAARYLAGEHGCRVTCLNLSETQNRRNRELTRAAGLAARVEVVHGNFESIPAGSNSYELVWSQDAILHSGDRPRVLREVRRVLCSGGDFLFTDPMQADDCPAGVLQPVLDRIHLDSLASFGFYRRELAALGFTEVACIDLTEQLIRHYDRVRRELLRRREELEREVSSDYIDRMVQGLGHWVEAGERGYLAWGILHFRC